MEKLFISMAVMAAFSLSTPASAGNDGDYHFHDDMPAKAETVSGRAVERQQTLIAGDKLDKSW